MEIEDGIERSDNSLSTENWKRNEMGERERRGIRKQKERERERERERDEVMDSNRDGYNKTPIQTRSSYFNQYVLSYILDQFDRVNEIVDKRVNETGVSNIMETRLSYILGQ